MTVGSNSGLTATTLFYKPTVEAYLRELPELDKERLSHWCKTKRALVDETMSVSFQCYFCFPPPKPVVPSNFPASKTHLQSFVELMTDVPSVVSMPRCVSTGPRTCPLWKRHTKSTILGLLFACSGYSYSCGRMSYSDLLGTKSHPLSLASHIESSVK